MCAVVHTLTGDIQTNCMVFGDDIVRENIAQDTRLACGALVMNQDNMSTRGLDNFEGRLFLDYNRN